MKIRTYFERFTIRIKQKIKFVTLWTLSLFLNGENPGSVTNSYELVINSNILPNSKFNPFKIQEIWSFSDRLWQLGRYKDSVKVRKEILENIYAINGIEEAKYFPPLLSAGFVNVIGHLGFLGNHLQAQKDNILTSGSRYLLSNKGIANKYIFNDLAQHFEIIPSHNGTLWSELPGVWHLVERLQLIRSEDGFIDLYELTEKVYSNNKITRMTPIIHFDDQIRIDSLNILKRYNFSSSDWFVCLHIRNSHDANDRRNQELDDYLPAVNEIIRRGGFVIRIGNKSMDALPSNPKIIDLLDDNLDQKLLHAFALANAKFMLGTTSGPALIPSLYGIPTLVTNLTSIARNSLSSSAGSFYLPKKVKIISGNYLSLAEILTRPESYSEATISELKKAGLELVNNSAEEILEATIEMFNNLDKGVFSKDLFPSAQAVNQIRNNHYAISRGYISESFISLNKFWLN